MKLVVVVLAMVSFLLLSTLTSAQTCLTGADNPAVNTIGNCDGEVMIDELEAYIQLWYGCSECYPDMFNSIEAYYDIPFCGDHSCNVSVGENCSSCPEDCGPCVPIDIKVEPGTTVEVGEEVFFDGSNVTITGAALLVNGMINGNYEWDFGDGSIDTLGTSQSHFYINPGIYTVSLNVTDVNGKTKIDTVDITVQGTQVELPPRPSVEPILELKFDGNLDDTSGNGHTAQWVGGTGSFVKGIEGQAVDLNGAYIEVLDSPLLSGMDELTISIWTRKNAAEDTGYLIDLNGAYSVWVLLDEHGYSRNPGGTVTTTSNTKSANKWPAKNIVNDGWHHYVIVYNGSTLISYVDGVYFTAGISALTGAVKTTGNSLLIGKKYDSPNIWEGYIDEVKIYDKALTQEEIHRGFELWHANFHGRIAQYIYAQIPEEFTKDPTNKINATITGDTGYSKVIYNKNNLQSEEKFLLNNSELPADNYTLTVQILDSGNNLLDEIIENFEKPYDGIPAFGIDENNAFRRNGELFFPVSPWQLPTSQFASWSDYINSLTGISATYDPPDPIDWETYLDAAEAVNWPVPGPGRWELELLRSKGNLVNSDPNQMPPYINQTRDHSALMGWQWIDELMYRGIDVPQIISWNYQPHKLDPNHPAFVDFRSHMWMRDFHNRDNYREFTTKNTYIYGAPYIGNKRSTIADVLTVGGWWPKNAYLNGESNSVAKHFWSLDNIQEENYNLIPISPMPEICDVNATRDLPPSAEQVKMFIWLSVIHGAKGVRYFQHFGTIPAENYDAMAEFLDHITQLTPVVLGPEVERVVTDNANDPGNRVDTMLREYEGDIYIFAVRLTEADEPQTGDYKTVTFNVEGIGDAIVDLFNETRTINIVSGSFQDIFAPNAVHIYKISEAPVGNVYYS